MMTLVPEFTNTLVAEWSQIPTVTYYKINIKEETKSGIIYLLSTYESLSGVHKH